MPSLLNNWWCSSWLPPVSFDKILNVRCSVRRKYSHTKLGSFDRKMFGDFHEITPSPGPESVTLLCCSELQLASLALACTVELTAHSRLPMLTCGCSPVLPQWCRCWSALRIFINTTTPVLKHFQRIEPSVVLFRGNVLLRI